MDELNIVYEVFVEYKGEKIVDSEIANILREIRENKSLLSVSKLLGISYAKLWSTISKIERLSGRKIVDARRGGRGGGKAELTDFGMKLLELYERAVANLEKSGLKGKIHEIAEKPEFTVAHSSDPVFSAVLEKLGEEMSIESFCVGSGMALAMLTLGEADVACIHLYDAEDRSYNKRYLERFWLKDKVEKIGSFERELVIAYRKNLNFESLEEIIHEILKGNLTVANRNRGSGTRVYFDQILLDYSKKLNMSLNDIKGYKTEFYSHEEVAKQIFDSKSDVGVLLRYHAAKYNLKFIHLTWEKYECYALRDRLCKVKRLKELMDSQWFKSLIELTPGYTLKHE